MLPYAFAVAAQTVVVIAGGVDLSVASMMALTSVTAARMMDGASDEFALLVVPLVLLLGLVLGALNGILIVVTRVPDIVVTLAMLFVLQGAALLVLDAPGGAAADWLKALIVGTVAVPGRPRGGHRLDPQGAGPAPRLPRRGVDSAPPLAPRPLDLRHRLAAARRLPQRRRRSPAPASPPTPLAGLFAAMGGLALTMTTGIGAPIPGPYLLASVAAVVLGGVTLGGGRGGLVGPIVAVFILRLVRTDLTFLAVDPNVTTIIEGTIMVVVVMLGAFIAMRGRTP